MDHIYDLESYPNIFTFCSVSADKKVGKVFEISDRKNQRRAMINHLKRLRDGGDRMVGFNNVGFDYQLLHWIIHNKRATAEDIYNKAQELIESQYGDDKKFTSIKEEDVIIPQVDLFKIHHFDNKARATSLKVIEFNMRSENIEDLPFEVGRVLTSDEMDELIRYNKHDALETLKFYHESLDKIKFREDLCVKYNKNFMNHNDTKIGKDYFIMRLEEAMPQCCYKIDKLGRRRIQQTKRKSIKLGECILPYIKFDRPEFQAVVDWLEHTEITQTKESLNDLLECDLRDVAKYCKFNTKSKTRNPKKKKLQDEPTDEERKELLKDNPSAWIEEVPLKSGKSSWYKKWNVAKNLNVVLNNFQFDFGTGGIHGSIEPCTVKSDDDYLIVDWDVASYYPNLAIANRVYPEHLSETFCDVYEDVYIQRKGFAKGTSENATMKLALNGVYGDSNSKFSPFYDPKYTMTITISGQLSLCMLSEKLLEIEGLDIIQINTDGVTVRVPRDRIDDHVKICEDWEKLTGLELERADYSAMYIRDVNNYIAQYTDGKLKRKGAYEYADLDWSKDHSGLVIPMAAEAFLIRGTPIEDFIKNHEEKMDFMMRVKVPRSSRLITRDEFEDHKQQNICRYYVSNEGYNLIKIMPPLEGNEKLQTTWKNPDTEETATSITDAEMKRVNKKGFTEKVGEEILPAPERENEVEAGWKVNVCNDMKQYDGDINYEYYIQAANKLVEEVKKCYGQTGD